MSADSDLQNAYGEWHRLAEAEGQAIRAGNWLLVTDCQAALRQLQPRIIQFTDQARREWTRSGVDQAAKETQLRGVIGSLIELERRNSEWINVRRETARGEMRKLEKARRLLKCIRQSYAPDRATSWNSFS